MKSSSLVALAIVVFAAIISPAASLRAASAVAIATNKNTGRLSYGYWKGDATESEAKTRALDYCRHMGWINPRIIGSTSRLGYAAVVWYETGDGKTHCVASLGEPTIQRAMSSALRKAKAAGGRYALVEATWHDGGGDNIRGDLIKL